MKKYHGVLVLVLLHITLAYAQKPSASAIASGHPLATQAGMQILEQGGNAFDAAITVAAVLAVVEPYHSGIGGGGFWLLQDASGTTPRRVIIDARERAPLAAKQEMFMKKGKPDEEQALNGALSAGIPGEPAALVYLAKHFGKLPLKQTLQPAITIAKEGFPIDKNFLRFLTEKQAKMQGYPSTQAIFFPGGMLPTVGSILKQPELAEVLTQIVQDENSFYTGKVAAQLVAGVKANGGIWELEDLKNYHIHILEPLHGQYHDMHLTTTPLPSGGGIGVITGLNILADYALAELSEADRKHLIIETLRRVYCDRTRYLGDPQFIKVDVPTLISKQHADEWRATIEMDRATKSADLQCGLPIQESEYTTHYSILDQEGNAVAATLTVNHYFGSSFVVPNTGILLNNEMDDFAIAVGVPNGYQLMGNTPNLIAPGKTPLSSMMPTFFETPQGMGILGVPGGSRIPSMMLLALLSAEKDFYPSTWMLAGRFHQQLLPDVVVFEPEALTVPMQHALTVRGHTLKPLERSYGDMQAIFWNKQTNQVYAASDPRGQGLAVVKKITQQH